MKKIFIILFLIFSIFSLPAATKSAETNQILLNIIGYMPSETRFIGYVLPTSNAEIARNIGSLTVFNYRFTSNENTQTLVRVSPIGYDHYFLQNSLDDEQKNFDVVITQSNLYGDVIKQIKTNSSTSFLLKAQDGFIDTNGSIHINLPNFNEKELLEAKYSAGIQIEIIIL